MARIPKGMHYIALIAVANKLMKQPFAIAKPGLIYDSEFRSLKFSRILPQFNVVTHFYFLFGQDKSQEKIVF
tara:strand:- start:73 stop:288 length:216 start_codon:yes stop_codon:yes gene_type:complete